MNGTFSKECDTFTFAYEFHTDKCALEKEVKLSLFSNDYIREMFTSYQAAYVDARAVYDDTSVNNCVTIHY